MAQEPNIATVFVQLDALLDSRIGTIARINPDAVQQLLQSGYRERLVDDFAGVDMQQYRDLYAKRDAETLLHSVETEMVFMLREMVDKLSEQTVVRPYHTGVKVVVNVYPYELGDEDKAIVKETVERWTSSLASVEIVAISDENLTPAHIKQNYSALILYNWDNWLRLQAEAFGKSPCKGVTVRVPQIYFHSTASALEEDARKMTLEIANPMDSLNWLTMSMFDLEIVSGKMYSITSLRHTPSSPSPTPNSGEG